MLKIKSFTFNPIGENTYVLYNENGQCVIIDPGCYFDEERDALAAFMKENDLIPLLLLNTHCHLDHVFGNKYVAEQFNLVPRIHRLEKPLLDYAPVSGLSYDMPFDNYIGEPEYFEAGDDIMIGADKLTILFTPGHSPGSVSFYSAEQHFVISGDALFHRSIGRTDLPGGNHEQLLGSIRSELLSLPAHTKVYSGHGPVTTIGDEKTQNPFLQP